MKKNIINLVLLMWLIMPISFVLANNLPGGSTPVAVKPSCNSGLCLNVPLGGVKQIGGFEEYLVLWYNFALGTAGIMATVIIMWGGFKWLTSRGNSAAISDAKDRIWSAIIGLVLVFLSYVLLSIINPKLLNISLPPLDNTTDINIDQSTLPADFVIDGGSGITYGTHPILETPTMFVSPDATSEQLANAQNECRNLCISQGYDLTGQHGLAGNSAQGYTCNCDIAAGITVQTNQSNPLNQLATNFSEELNFSLNNNDEIVITWTNRFNSAVDSMIESLTNYGYQVTDNRNNSLPHIVVGQIPGSVLIPR